jgi:Tol biopolymer transport system component
MTRGALTVSLVLATALAGCAKSDTASSATTPVATALSPDSVRHISPSYSPDGRQIAYWAPAGDSTSDLSLWVANADLSSPKSLGVRGGPNAPNSCWSPDGSRIAAASNQFSASSVVAVTLATGQVDRLTNVGGFAVPIGWSHDGQSLAVLRTSPDGSLRTDLLSIATGTMRPLLPGETRPYFAVPSPKGPQILLNRFDGSQSTLWVLDSLDATPRQLTTEGFEELVLAPWSPDGRAVLYQSRRTGTVDLWIAPIDGSAPRQLTRNVRNDFNGAWSPDGAWVAFLSDRGRQTDVWMVPAAGGEERRVTNSREEETNSLVWRPGVSLLAFSVATERNSLWAMDVATGSERRLTPDSVRLNDFWVSPDGRTVSVVVNRGGGSRELGILPVTGGDIRTLLSGEFEISRPLFSPDGQSIVYRSDRGGSFDVWVVDVGGGAPRQLTNWPGLEGSPVWSADGSAVLFIADRDSRLGDVWRVSRAGGTPVRVTNDGAVLEIFARAGLPGTYATRLNPNGGQFGVVGLRDDGTVQEIWSRSNVGRLIPFSADSMLAMVEQPDGTLRGMLLSTTGGGGRLILPANGYLGWPTPDAKQLSFTLPDKGEDDVYMLTIADGTIRRLTRTPESEAGGEFTPDGKTAVYLRVRKSQRIVTTDLSALLQGSTAKP